MDWGLGGLGACPLENVWNLHISNCWKCTNFLKDGHLGLLWRHSERQFSKMKPINSRVTHQKSANAWEMLVSAWVYIEMHETCTQCVRLESSSHRMWICVVCEKLSLRSMFSKMSINTSHTKSWCCFCIIFNSNLSTLSQTPIYQETHLIHKP